MAKGEGGERETQKHTKWVMVTLIYLPYHFTIYS